MSRLDADEKGIVIVDTLGGPQKMLCVNESGLYAITISSRKPEAKRFRKWITSEVLPALRKTGSFTVAPEPLEIPQPKGEAIAARRAQDAGARTRGAGDSRGGAPCRRTVD